ncbi:hypothetical protein [Serratia marcescens]|uniref:hypothetical protein n=1 Tax=Serratia TaxID=613 RepID=UPI000B41DA6D|nr:hypothetical protein [Serratia marcescens]RNW08246.1 hypothetical protein CAG37_012920 [Serratia nematodiphila]MDP8607184.1 hypothetical protein [Serratia marcescens]MDP8875812.1 hypothetical protein [Serratia marcescens]BEM39928.1 hypothetical protein SME10J_36550 [Serratia marcescens]HAT3848728.1 hypothetical protein [Serratia marcescens]
MHKDAYWLINDCTNMTLAEAAELKIAAAGASETILEGVDAIGNIMFWAAENENYTPEQSKKDMLKLGDMLSTISRLALGAKHAEASISYRIREGK